MVTHFLQHFDEIRLSWLAELLCILDKTLHSLEAGFVERFKDVKRGKQKGA